MDNEAIVKTLIENQAAMNANPVDPEIGEYKRFSVPLVRRIYPQLIANNIVSVQPLLGPTGLTQYIRNQYSSQKEPEDWTPPKPKQVWRGIDEPFEPSWQ